MFKPMLAGKAPDDLNKLRFPVLVSCKLDGIRVIVINGVVMSRNLKPIPNARVQRIFGRKRYNGFDGELIVGDPCSPDVFRNTSSGVMSRDGEPDLKFYVFDDVTNMNLPFNERFSALAERILDYRDDVLASGASLNIVTQCPVEDADQLETYEQGALDDGYEGLMLRDNHGPYKQGRSTTTEGWLLKLKRFHDSEAVIEGWEERQHNANAATTDALGRTKRTSHKAGMVATGVLGALRVRDLASGASFNVGTGFNDDERAALWSKRESLAGKVISYRFFPSGSKDKPRFPTYRGFRDVIDL